MMIRSASWAIQYFSVAAADVVVQLSTNVKRLALQRCFARTCICFLEYAVYAEVPKNVKRYRKMALVASRRQEALYRHGADAGFCCDLTDAQTSFPEL